jgi:hypothetical protein
MQTDYLTTSRVLTSVEEDHLRWESVAVLRVADVLQQMHSMLDQLKTKIGVQVCRLCVTWKIL